MLSLGKHLREAFKRNTISQVALHHVGLIVNNHLESFCEKEQKINLVWAMGIFDSFNSALQIHSSVHCHNLQISSRMGTDTGLPCGFRSYRKNLR